MKYVTELISFVTQRCQMPIVIRAKPQRLYKYHYNAST